MIIRSDEAEDVPVPGGGTMRVHLFRPAVAGRFPGVLFFSEIYQVTDPIRRLAAMVAGQGYVVGVPEVYHEYEPAGTVLAYDKPGTDRGNALKFTKPIAAFDADARAGLAFLDRHPACTGKLATLGVCLGGHLAYRAALDPSVSAAACFYATDIHSGTLGANQADDSLARLDELKAEALFVWGRQDPHVPFAGRQVIRARLEEVGARYEWHEVNAQHAFLRDEGARYDPALFLQAMAWMLALFQRTLQAAD
jgi:carboxymethylenebutenolidase